MPENPREEQLLRSAPLFGGMDAENARSLIAKMVRKEVSRGETLFREGDDGHAMYVLVRGKVKLARTARDGRENLLALMGVSRHMLRALAQRIRRTSNTMADLIFSDVPGRVAKAILDLGHRFGRMERGHVTVRHGLTQEELAQLVGASRETVNKALADFASRGWIDVHIGAVEVYEPERLRARSR
jgi:CRP/FNR family transcriptional regulator